MHARAPCRVVIDGASHRQLSFCLSLLFINRKLICRRLLLSRPFIGLCRVGPMVPFFSSSYSSAVPLCPPLCKHTQYIKRMTGPSAGRFIRAKYDAAAAHSGRLNRTLFTYFSASRVSIFGHSCFSSAGFPRKKAVRGS